MPTEMAMENGKQAMVKLSLVAMLMQNADIDDFDLPCQEGDVKENGGLRYPGYLVPSKRPPAAHFIRCRLHEN